MNDLEKRRAKRRQEHSAAIESMCQGALGKSRSQAVADGAKFSGAHIEGFREGWAIPVNFKSRVHGKPHYYRRIDLTHKYVSLCGVEVDQERYHPGARKVFAPGTFMAERCKRCERKL